MRDDFTLSEEERQVRDLARGLARAHIAPRAAVVDEAELYPAESLAHVAQAGLMGLYVPERYGGAGLGALAPEMPDGFLRYFYLDWDKRQTEFKPGITLDLQPFPGTLAVGIDPKDPSPRKGGATDPLAPVSTLRPWKNGSNMDINELQEGSSIFIPVFLKGALIWTGDSHCRQGNGEVNLTALECANREIVIQPIVHKGMKTEWPRLETKTHWVLTGFDEDLNKAMVIAVREAVDFLAAQKAVPLTRYEAYSLVSMVGDCRVSQVVDVRKGVHCMVPKSVFAKR